MLAQVKYDGGVQVHDEPMIDANWQSQTCYSHDEFWNKAYADLGQRYGLDDIRDAE